MQLTVTSLWWLPTLACRSGVEVLARQSSVATELDLFFQCIDIRRRLAVYIHSDRGERLRAIFSVAIRGRAVVRPCVSLRGLSCNSASPRTAAVNASRSHA